MSIRFRMSLCLFMTCLLILPLLSACRTDPASEEQTVPDSEELESPPQLPYTFDFVSNGDGSCDIVSVRFDSTHAEATTLCFPAESGDGERVAAVRCKIGFPLPEIIAAEDFEQHLLEPLAERVGKKSEEYRSFAGAWEKFDFAKQGQTATEVSIGERCPMALVTPVYVRRHTPSYATDNTADLMQIVASLGYTEEDLRAEYQHLIDLARASDLTEELIAAACAQVPLENRIYCPLWITGMEFPAGLEYADPQVWAKCPWLERLVLPACAEPKPLDLACSPALREVVLPEGIAGLCDRTFAHCRGLERVTLPSSLTALPPGLFDGCDALKEIVFTGSLSEWQALTTAADTDPQAGAPWGDAVGIPVRCTDGSGIYGEAVPEPYRLTFTSNQDGTCTITHVWFNPSYTEPFILEFPAVSPDGEPVTAVRYNVSPLLPRWIPQKVFNELIRKPLIDAVIDGRLGDGISSTGNPEDNFYYRVFLTYYQLKDPALETDPNAVDAMLEVYPVTAEFPIYVLASDASVTEINKINQQILKFCPDYNADQMEADHRITGYTKVAGATVVYPSNLTGIVFAPEISEVLPEVYLDCTTPLERLVLPVCAVFEDQSNSVPYTVQELVMPEGITRIGNATLQHCDALRLLWIPRSVSEIAEGELQSLAALQEIRYAGTLDEWQALNVLLPAGVTVTCADGTVSTSAEG